MIKPKGFKDGNGNWFFSLEIFFATLGWWHTKYSEEKIGEETIQGISP